MKHWVSLVTRKIYPSMSRTAVCDEWEVSNDGDKPIMLDRALERVVVAQALGKPIIAEFDQRAGVLRKEMETCK